MKINKSLHNIRKLSLLFLVVITASATINPVLAASYSGATVPLDSSSVPVTPSPPNVITATAPAGDWTTLASDNITGQDISVGGYQMPNISASGVCNNATITALSVVFVDASIVLGSVTSQDQVGVAVSVADMDAPFDAKTVSSVTSGTMVDGSFAVSLNPDSDTTIVGRGLIHPWWTTVPTPLPGSIEFSIDTTGMTVADYNNLAVVVTHDLNSGPEGLVDSVTTSQPTITVQYDPSACNPPTSTVQVSQPSPPATLANTGTNMTFLNIIAVSMLTLGTLIISFIGRRNKQYLK